MRTRPPGAQTEATDEVEHAGRARGSAPSGIGIDWRELYASWEHQQTHDVHRREDRFEAMLEVLGAVFGDRPFVALDLACGPGSVSQRVLARFARARCVGVEFDPVLIAIGREALAEAKAGRLRFVDADLRDASWADRVGEPEVDAVVSSTALHWLAPGDLVQVYRSAGLSLRPGGVLVNCDLLRYPARLETIRRIDEAIRARRGADPQRIPYADWWRSLAEEPALRELFAERARRSDWRPVGDYRPGIELHRAALEEAGFREVDTIMQDGITRVLVAVR